MINNMKETDIDYGSLRTTRNTVETDTDRRCRVERLALADESTPLITDDYSNDVIKDRCGLVFFIFLFQGIGVMLPWHLFMTSKSYFTEYKMAKAGNADYRLNFLSYIGIASQVPNMAWNGMNLFCQRNSRSGSTTRIVISLLVLVSLFVMTTIFAVVDSYEWPEIFFAVTIMTVVLVNAMSGIYINSIYGLAAMFPKHYVNATMTGANVSGLVMSLLLLVTKFSDTDRSSAIYFFIAGTLVLLVALDTMLALPFSRYFRLIVSESATANTFAQHESLPYGKTFKKIWVQLVDVWAHRFITMCVYPAMVVDVKRFNEDFFVPEYLYEDIMCYMLSNIAAVVGNLCCYLFHKPSTKYTIIPLALRALGIVLLVLCNYRPDTRSFPVLIKSDWAFMIVVIVMGLTNGYYSGLTMMYAKTAAGSDARMQRTAGMMAGFVQSIGFFMGHQFTLLITYFVENLAIS
ncbi:equilibrative nucleoside transporter 3-like isoform X2 [Tubulanus polymorphus]|uniref:equilibrative nucleoside transporter 3-like isoform X2 n=1 Tax=Tubulanus polymorphus TaxID=672921 RepID=UPI003DA1CD2A